MLKHARYSHVCTQILPPLTSSKTPLLPCHLNLLPTLQRIARLQRPNETLTQARRRVRYEEEEECEEESGYNAEIAMLESYSESSPDEVLLVRATVDDQEEQVLIFKGFSSSLSFGTSPDPSKSVLPEKAVIKSIDRIRGPFNPSNVEYLEQGLTWEAFKPRLQTNKL